MKRGKMEKQANLENKLKKFKLGKIIIIGLIIAGGSLLQGCGDNLYYPDSYLYRNYYDDSPGYYQNFNGYDSFYRHYYGESGCW